MKKRSANFDSLPQAVRDAIAAWDAIKKSTHPSPEQMQVCLGVLRRVAQAWGGDCLSEQYLSFKRNLKFRCGKGHEWEFTPDSLLYGAFCPHCLNRERLDAIQEEVKLRVFTCLSSEYVKYRSPLRWRCEKGHEWSASYFSIRNGSGCPDCYRERVYSTLEVMQRLAQEKDGRCLSEHFRNLRSNLSWECHHGHVWDATGQVVMNGGWCPECRRMAHISKRRSAKLASLSQEVQDRINSWVPAKSRRGPDQPDKMACLEVIRSIAHAWGGECLSEQYLGFRYNLKFRCGKGHECESTPHKLLEGYFCPQCLNRRRVRLDVIREEVLTRGFTCLSSEYANISTPLRWRCEKGHEWSASFASIRNGSGCPDCYRERVYFTLETMQELAHKNGGKCLSERYSNVNHKLTWECHRGHRWDAQAAGVLSGSWCPQCAILARIHKAGSKARLKYMPSKAHG